MKPSLKHALITIFVVLGVGLGIAAVKPVVLADYTFTSSVTIPIANSDLQPSYLTAVEMSFASAQSNAFALIHTRGSNTATLLSVPAASMQTLTWYPPRPLFLKDGDSLTFTNSVAAEAYLSISVEKYRN